MRLVIRSALVAYVAIEASQRIVGGFDFGSNSKSLIFVLVAILLLNVFMIPLFRILSLPHYGVGFMFLNLLLTFVILYILTIFLPSFEIVETELGQLRIFGFVLPSRSLSVVWSAVASALVISVLYHFIEWLFEKR